MMKSVVFWKVTFVSFLMFALSACGDFSITDYASAGAISPLTPSERINFGLRGISSWSQTVDISDDSPQAMLRLSDGRIWIAAYSTSNAYSNGVIKSFNADGTLDTTFSYGRGDTIPYAAPAGSTYPSRIVEFEDYVYIAGQVSPGDEDVVLMRFHKDGSIDSSFGAFGGVTFDLAGNSDLVSDMVVQSDGKILIAGQTAFTSFFAIRVNADGTLDTGFATGGIFIERFVAGSSTDEAFRILLQSDGKIILVGSSDQPAKKIGMMRLNSNGTLDASFGTGGKATASASASNNIRDAHLYSDGKILVAGDDDTSVILAKFTSSGALDTTFNTTGYVVRKFSGADNAVDAFEVQSDGKIVVAGAAGPILTSQSFMARFNADGSTDTTFNTTGYKIFDLVNGESSRLTTVISVTGEGYLTYGGTEDASSVTSTVITKLSSAGALDTSFNATGTRVINTGEVVRNLMRNVKGLSNGKVLSVGTAETSLSFVAQILRFNADGSIDTSFAVNGVFDYDLGFPAQAFNFFVEQSDKKVIALMSYDVGPGREIRMVRLNENGTLDSTFNGSGYVDIPVSGDVNNAGSISLGSDEKIYITGTTITVPTAKLFVARYSSNGTLDTTFNSTGILEYDPGSGFGMAANLKELADGKIIVSGINMAEILVMKLNADGSFDTSFATAGVHLANPLGGMRMHEGRDISVVGGKILIVGNQREMPNPPTAFIYRLNDDGSADPGFGTNGMVTTSLQLKSALIEDDGKIMTGMMSNSSYEVQVQRYSADGSVDTSFNNGSAMSVMAPFEGFQDLVGLAKSASGEYIFGSVGAYTIGSAACLMRVTEEGIQ